MAQGTTKKQTTSVLARKAAQKRGTIAARGIRIAPKTSALISQKKMQKKLSSRNITHTESLMAARAGATGKLTIMKGVADKALETAKAKENAKK